MERTTLLWVFVLFLGTSVVFRALRRLTEDQAAGVTIAVQVAALAAIVGVVVLVVRRQRRR
jgi:membrane protein DedA with SNARE-associated domain